MGKNNTLDTKGEGHVRISQQLHFRWLPCIYFFCVPEARWHMFFHILFHVNLHRKFTMGVSLLFSYFCEETEVSVSGKLVMFLCSPCMGESECKFKEIDKVLFPRPSLFATAYHSLGSPLLGVFSSCTLWSWTNMEPLKVWQLVQLTMLFVFLRYCHDPT